MAMRADAGLVLEGGGMRAQYASGVMDWLLGAGLRFPYVVGVSAGISNAASYVAGQAGRNREVFMRFAGDRRYFSWWNVWREGNPFGMDFIYREIPKMIPLDFAAFEASAARFRVGVTDCATGAAVWLDKGDAPLVDALLASSSLPVVGRMAWLGGRPVLDGGIVDPIPFGRAAADGVARRVVVLTRNAGFRKRRPGAVARALVEARYGRRWPALAAAVGRQWATYNARLEELEAEERAGRVLVIRPGRPLRVGRYSQDRSELDALYHEGIRDAAACEGRLREFVEG